MESAGRAVVEAVLEWLPPGGSVVAVCGGGNNGGDGLVVARQLQLLGAPVRAALLCDEKTLRGDAAANLKRARAAGVPIDGERWRAPVAGVIVDAIFGTGLSRDVAGPAAASIRRINAARESRAGAVRVVAVDLPSGLGSDSGQILQTFGPNEIIGEIGTISPQHRRTITLSAATAVDLFEWDFKAIEKELPELFPRLRDLAKKRALRWNY